MKTVARNFNASRTRVVSCDTYVNCEHSVAWIPILNGDDKLTIFRILPLHVEPRTEITSPLEK